MHENLSHFGSILYSLKRLFSFHGVYEFFSITGFWILLIIPAFAQRIFLKTVARFDFFVFWFVVSVFFQAILSTDIARMLYMLTPVLAAFWAMIIVGFTPENLRLKLNIGNQHF